MPSKYATMVICWFCKYTLYRYDIMHTYSNTPTVMNYFRCSLLARSRDEKVRNQLGGVAMRGINIQKKVQFDRGNITICIHTNFHFNLY